MKNVIKIALFLMSFAITSCSSDDKKSNEYVFTETVYAMTGSLDGGVAKKMRNLAGTSTANPNSTEFGLSYFTLNGYFDTGSPDARDIFVQDKVVTVNLAIPKDNIVLGDNFFNNTLVASGYFGGLNIKTNGVNETVNTVSGRITVLTYDELTGEISGTYEINTTNGASIPQTHHIAGGFNYKLIE